jgi:hypothetical protein
VETESNSKTRWFWISLCTVIALILVIAIKQTADRRDAVRQNKVDQPSLNGQ